ncbi:MAG: 2-oxo acid dehydrogenase subunit E2 [Verrucomicrobiota bacterium]
MPIEFRLPELGEKITSGDVVKVLVNVGDVIAKDQSVLEMETDKAVLEVPSSAAGKILEIHVKAGDKASVGQLILTLEGTESAAGPVPSESAPARPASAPRPVAAAPSPPLPEARPSPIPPFARSSSAPASPSVRQFAREIGVDIAQVTPSAPDGRLSIEDVKKFAKQILTSVAARVEGGAPRSAPAATVELPDFAKWGAIERQPMTSIRRKTAEHVTLAWTTIPHVTQFDRADITELEERRKKLSPKAEKAGAKLTITPILVKIASAALKVFPKFNASIDPAKGEIILKKYFRVGVAVDTERGLLVPVVRDADKKNIIQIAAELSQLAEKARGGKVALEDLQGGTFTITNLGGIGGSHFTPIVNFPQVAILGVGRAVLEPSFGEKDGCCKPRLMLPLSLSYDHRLIDGADGARFLRWIVEAIEEPLLIPLEG